MKRDLDGITVPEKQNDVERRKEENPLNSSESTNKKARICEYEKDDSMKSSSIPARMNDENNKEDDQNCGIESHNIHATVGGKDHVQNNFMQIDTQSILKTQEENPTREESITQIEKIEKDRAESSEQSNNGNMKDINLMVTKETPENDDSAQPITNRRKLKKGEEVSQRIGQTSMKESAVGGENELDAKDEVVKTKKQTGSVKEENLEIIMVETNYENKKCSHSVENQRDLKEDDEEPCKESDQLESKENISEDANDLVVKYKMQTESVQEENLEVVTIESNADEKSAQSVEDQCKRKEEGEEADEKLEQITNKESISECESKKTAKIEDQISGKNKESHEVGTIKTNNNDDKSAQPNLQEDGEDASENMKQNSNKETITKDNNEETANDDIKNAQSNENVSNVVVEEKETKMEDNGEDTEEDKIKDIISNYGAKDAENTDIGNVEKRELQETEMEEMKGEEKNMLIGEDFQSKETSKVDDLESNEDASEDNTEKQDIQMEQKEEIVTRGSRGISAGIEERKETTTANYGKSAQAEDKTTSEEIARHDTKKMKVEYRETFELLEKGENEKIGGEEKDEKVDQAQFVEDIRKNDQPNNEASIESTKTLDSITEVVTRTKFVESSIELDSSTVCDNKEPSESNESSHYVSVSIKKEKAKLETKPKEIDGLIKGNNRSESNSIETPLIASTNFDEPSTNVSSSTRLAAGRRLTFPEKLMELLNKEDCQDAMCWLTNGKAFALQPSIFMQKILPKYFEGTKFESFTRKLNRWGFKRIAGEDAPDDTFAYSHHLFKRDYPELCRGMSGGKKMEQDFSHLIRYRERERLLTSAAANPTGLLSAGQFSFGTTNMGTIGGIAGMGTVGGIGGLSALGGIGSIGLQSGFEQQAQLQNLLLERQFAAAGGINGNPYNNFGGPGGLERELAIREMLLRQEATAGGQAALFGSNANFVHSVPPGGAMSTGPSIQTGNQSSISANMGASFSPIAPGVNIQSLNMQQTNLMSAALQQEAILGTMESQPGIQILVPQRGAYDSSATNVGVPKQSSTTQVNYNKRNYAELV